LRWKDANREFDEGAKVIGKKITDKISKHVNLGGAPKKPKEQDRQYHHFADNELGEQKRDDRPDPILKIGRAQLKNVVRKKMTPEEEA